MELELQDFEKILKPHHVFNTFVSSFFIQFVLTVKSENICFIEGKKINFKRKCQSIVIIIFCLIEWKNERVCVGHFD